MDPDLIFAFRDAFAEIPQRVVWKFEERIENISANVMLSEWIPQRDILGIFISKIQLSVFRAYCGANESRTLFYAIIGT